jgi:hypothetical protein
MLKTLATALNKSKKKEKVFFFFKFLGTLHKPASPRSHQRSAMRPWGTWEGTNKGVDHAKRIERRNLRG